MRIKIDDTYYPVTVTADKKLQMDLPGSGVICVDDLHDLLGELRSKFKSVALPPKLFTDDLYLVDTCLKVGFIIFEPRSVPFKCDPAATLSPVSFSDDEAAANPSLPLSNFRVYSLSWFDEGGMVRASLHSESELEEMGILPLKD